MQIVILAGGLAKRLRPLTFKIPKSMIKIHNKPFLEYQIELLKENGIKDIILCVGYLGEMIQNYFGDGKNFGVKIKYSYEKDKLLGTGGALKKAESLLKDEFFLMYGDSYLLFDYQRIKRDFEKSGRLSLLVVYRNEDKYDKSNVAIEDGMVKTYDKKNKMRMRAFRKEGMVYIDSGLCVLRKKALESMPENRFFDLGFLYQKLVEKKQMSAYEVQKRFYEIGSFSGLKEFEDLIKRGCYDSHKDTGEDSFRWRRDRPSLLLPSARGVFSLRCNR